MQFVFICQCIFLCVFASFLPSPSQSFNIFLNENITLLSIFMNVFHDFAMIQVEGEKNKPKGKRFVSFSSGWELQLYKFQSISLNSKVTFFVPVWLLLSYSHPILPNAYSDNMTKLGHIFVCWPWPLARLSIALNLSVRPSVCLTWFGSCCCWVFLDCIRCSVK